MKNKQKTLTKLSKTTNRQNYSPSKRKQNKKRDNAIKHNNNINKQSKQHKTVGLNKIMHSKR